MRTRQARDFAEWYSFKTTAVKCRYFPQLETLHIYEGQNYLTMWGIKVSSKNEAKEKAKKVIDAYELAYSVAQIIGTDSE